MSRLYYTTVVMKGFEAQPNCMKIYIGLNDLDQKFQHRLHHGKKPARFRYQIRIMKCKFSRISASSINRETNVFKWGYLNQQNRFRSKTGKKPVCGGLATYRANMIRL